MKINLLVLTCFTLLQLNLLGQENFQIDSTDHSQKISAISMGFYLDNGLHPGLKFGASYELSSKIKEKKYRLNFRKKKFGVKRKEIYYLLDGNLGFYQHPNNHFGAFTGLAFTRMRYKPKNKGSIAWTFGVNYLRRFYNIETYELGPNGNIVSVPFAGTNSLMFHITPSFGKTYRVVDGGRSCRFFIAPSLQVLKYNHAFFPNASLEIGAAINLNK